MKDFECRERYHGIDEYDLTRGQCGVWLINDDYVIDHHIRFEQLERDIKKFCKTTGSALLDLANERSDYVNRVTKKNYDPNTIVQGAENYNNNYYT